MWYQLRHSSTHTHARTKRTHIQHAHTRTQSHTHSLTPLTKQRAHTARAWKFSWWSYKRGTAHAPNPERTERLEIGSRLCMSRTDAPRLLLEHTLERRNKPRGEGTQRRNIPHARTTAADRLCVCPLCRTRPTLLFVDAACRSTHLSCR